MEIPIRKKKGRVIVTIVGSEIDVSRWRKKGLGEGTNMLEIHAPISRIIPVYLRIYKRIKQDKENGYFSVENSNLRGRSYTSQNEKEDNLTSSFIGKNKDRKNERNRVGFCESTENEAKATTRARKKEKGKENGKEEKLKEERVSGWFIESLLLVDCGTRNVRGTAG